VPVVVCDTTSEYPSVAGLLGLWPVLTAASLKVVNCTQAARVALNHASVESILQPSTWHDLAFFALVEPSHDLLPVRTLYGETGNTNIGLNPLTSKNRSGTRDPISQRPDSRRARTENSQRY